MTQQQRLDLLNALNEAMTIISMNRNASQNNEVKHNIEEALTALSEAGTIILKEYAANK